MFTIGLGNAHGFLIVDMKLRPPIYQFSNGKGEAYSYRLIFLLFSFAAQ